MVFVSTNRDRDRIKLLHRDGTAMWALTKRLDRAREREGREARSERKGAAMGRGHHRGWTAAHKGRLGWPRRP
jgi:hypothetical protein